MYLRKTQQSPRCYPNADELQQVQKLTNIAAKGGAVTLIYE